MAKVTWFGHAAFALQDAEDADDGFTVLIDPWLKNPKAPEGALEALKRVDAVLITHGHFDHVGDVVAVLDRFPTAKVYCIFELAATLTSESSASPLPADAVTGVNKGGWVDLGSGWRAVLTNAVHSSGCGVPPFAAGGEAGGWVVQLGKSGKRVYHAGDTDAHADMPLISDMHQPTLALLPIGGLYTMDHDGAAYCINKLLPSVKTVVPMHYGTFPPLTGSPTKLKAAITRNDVEVHVMEPGAIASL